MQPPVSPTDPHRLANSYLKQHVTTEKKQLTLRYWRGEWSSYAEGRYLPVSGETVRHSVARHIKQEIDAARATNKAGTLIQVNTQLINNTVQWVGNLAEIAENHELPCWIGKGRSREYLALENGLISLSELTGGSPCQAHLHTPEWFSTVRLPYRYVASASAPTWKAFLAQVLEDDAERIALLQEWFGYCLTPDVSRQRFMLLVGEGANGKSVVLNLLTDMLGEDNVSTVPPEKFGDRFRLAQTLGELANICADVDEQRDIPEGLLKQFTGGDRLQFERKYRDPFSARPTARLVLSMNHQPKFMDRSKGVWRRLLTVPFRVTIPLETQDPRLREKLQKELPGIFNWAIEGLRRLQAQNGFTQSSLVEQVREEYRRESNPAGLFLEEHTLLKAGAETVCFGVYCNYRNWAEARGYRPLDEREFGKEVRRRYPSLERKRIKTPDGRKWGYVGLAHDPMRPMWSEEIGREQGGEQTL